MRYTLILLASCYLRGGLGGVFPPTIEPLGPLGRFILVILALTIAANLAGPMYIASLNSQGLCPFLSRIPRALQVIVTTAMMIPMGGGAEKSFSASPEYFVKLISYWREAWVSVVRKEHIWFRKGNASTYQTAISDSPKELSLGIAASGTNALSFALVIPCMIMFDLRDLLASRPVTWDLKLR